MGVMLKLEQEQEAIFENAGQAVHVAFLIMAQEATQDAPLRKAIIRVMESIKLETKQQRHWLDQLRGERGAGTVNFEGLSPGDIRAQCALITQAVTTNLPEIERWVLQAKYGQTDFEDGVVGSDEDDLMLSALNDARDRAHAARVRINKARDAFTAALAPPSPWRTEPKDKQALYQNARDELSSANHEWEEAQRAEQLAQVAVDQTKSSGLIDSGRRLGKVQGRRRWAFSAERIAAIKGLSDWFAPMFPRIKPLAIDCLLGMLYANHKKIEISTRDLAKSFGGSHMNYYRASCKMRNHLRKLEESALARLEPAFTLHGVSCGK